MRDQLDLLAWEPPAIAADIVAFPQERNLGRARRVVDAVVTKRTQSSRQRYFDRVLFQLGSELEAAGLGASQINRELDAFTRAVNAELWRREARRQPGGRA